MKNFYPHCLLYYFSMPYSIAQTALQTSFETVPGLYYWKFEWRKMDGSYLLARQS